MSTAPDHPTVGLCILAGGKASRMGGADKSQLSIGDTTILEHLTREFSCFSERFLASGSRAIIPPAGFVAVPDLVSGIGPMGALAAALERSTCAGLFVCACDMPGLCRANYEALLPLFQGGNAVVSRNADGLHPLCAIYPKSCLPALLSCIQSRVYRLRALLECIDTVYVNQPQANLVNVNSPEDLRQLSR